MSSKNAEPVVIIGAGGQCRVILAIIRRIGNWLPIGIVDTGFRGQDECIAGVPVLGGMRCLPELRNRARFSCISIGDNRERDRHYELSKRYGFEIPTIVDPCSFVDESSFLGQGTLVCPQAAIGPDVVIGTNSIINTGAIVEHECLVGDHCHIAPGAVLAGRCRIGSNVLLGIGAVVLPNVKIASNTTIGAGCTVTKDIEHSGTYIGTPAKELKQ